MSRSDNITSGYSRLRIDGGLIDKVLSKYDIANMSKGEAEDDLTEKETVFAREYVRCFNVSQAALNAGVKKSTAHIWGSATIRKLKVIRYVLWLKHKIEQESHFKAVDFQNKLVSMINVDATDYVSFGTKVVPKRDKGKILTDENGQIIFDKVAYMELKDSDKVDGSLIQEIGWGKNGPYIKFYDKLKAMDTLTQFSPMTHQAQMQQAKLQLEKEKLALQKASFLHQISRDTRSDGDDEAVARLKEKMEQRKMKNGLDRSCDKRLLDREGNEINIR